MLQSISPPKAKLHIDKISIAKINARRFRTKTIEAFRSSLKDVYFDDMTKISQACKNSDSVKTLTVDWNKGYGQVYQTSLSHTFKLTPLNLKTFTKNIKNFSTLRSLTLRFSLFQGITDMALEELSQTLKRLDSLRKIHLSFAYCRSFGMKGLESLGKALKRLVFLEDVELDFAGCGQIHDLELMGLSKGLEGDRHQMKRIKVILTGCGRITALGFDWLSQKIEKFGASESLALNLATVSHGAKIGLESVSEALKKLPALKCLNLNFQVHTTLTDDDLEHLTDGLKGKRFMKNLSLNFGSANSTGYGIKKMCEALEEMELLNDLTLNFYSCREGKNEGLERLKAVRDKLTLLKYVDISLGRGYEIKGH